MLQIKKINKYFNKGKENEIHVINDTSILFPENGLVAILGTSGSGKSTLLNSLCGIDKVDSGTIIIDEVEITKYKSNKIDDLRNKNFGYIFQNYNLINELTVFDNVAISLEMLGIKDKEEIKTRVIQALKVVKMEKYKNRKAMNLSGGEQQRVGIARAIVKDAKYILADEPTGNLDLKNTISIMKILEEISKTRLVIMVTHEKELASSYANVIIKISDGKVISYEINDKKDKVNYIDENEIYLNELEIDQKYSDENISVSSYGNVPLDLDLDIKLVVIDNRLFIKSKSDKYNVRIVDDNSLVQFIEEDRISLEETTEKVLPIDSSKLKTKNNISLITYIKKGFTNFFRLKFIKKVLLFAFLISSFLLTLSLGIYRGTTKVKEEFYMQSNRDAVQFTINSSDKNEVIELFNDIISKEEVYGFELNTNYAQISVEKYYQSVVNTVHSNSFSIIGYNKITNYNGVIPNDGEVVLDLLLANNICSNNSIYLKDINSLINKTLFLRENEYKIIGFAEMNNFTVYMTEKDSLYANADFTSYVDIKKYEDVVTNYSKPNKGEILINNDFNEFVNTNYIINNLTYKVVGTFTCDNEDICYVFNDADFIEQLIARSYSNTFNLLSSDPLNTVKEIDKEKVNAYSVNEYNKDEYINSFKTISNTLFIISLVSFFAPLLMLYFLMKSNMINKIKEIGIYRALGIRKSNIIKMHLGEVLSITFMFSIPGYLLALLLMYNTKTSIIPLFSIDTFVILVSLIAIVFINLLVGLLPIGRLLRKTPQEIIIKYDI